MSAPHEGHFTERQMAIRGSGAEHCGQLSATQAISRRLPGKGAWRGGNVRAGFRGEEESQRESYAQSLPQSVKIRWVLPSLCCDFDVDDDAVQLDQRAESSRLPTMSTVAEIERAIEQLPPDQMLEVAAWLDEHRRRVPAWPVPPPDVPLDELKRIEAEIDAVFSRVES
jgi:hypothetical protein